MDENIIGKKFNYLTVVGFEMHSNRIRCKCICDCGNIVYTTEKRLKTNRSKSCGCKKVSALSKYQYLIGQRINYWNIIDIEKVNNKTYAKCVCNCGTEKYVNIYNLINGRTKDCGCTRKKQLSTSLTKNLIGKKFGRLIVIERVGSNRHKRALYLCKCECGNETVVPSNLLLNHHTSSCGCILSYYNSYIRQLLMNLNINFIPEYVVEIKGKKFRYDFYLPDYNTIIEYDGEQHFYPVNFGHSNYQDVINDFKRNQKHDRIKNKYCYDNKIILLRIPYTERQNIDEIINNHLQRLNEKGII